MKRITILFLILFCVGFAQAQIVNIPDANFKAALIGQGVDTSGDSEIQITEAIVVVDLSLSNSSISSLIGIEEFTNVRSLYASYNNITNLDISQNVLLETFYIQDNQLNSLDISQNIQLKYLLADRNEITNIGLSQNTNLQIMNLRRNLLTNIDVSQNLMLEEINISQNNLESIDVSNNVNLTNLVMTNTGLSNIDLTQNINLTSLFIGFNQLTSLNLTNNLYLTTLHCDNNQITSLDFNQNKDLASLSCRNNYINTLDVSYTNQLNYLRCEDNNLITLIIKNGNSSENLSLDNNPNLIYICADEQQVLDVLSIVSSDVVVNSYCSFTPGGNYNSITGQVQYDIDSNGCDSADILIPYSRIDINDGTETVATFTNALGNYSFYSDSSDFTITPKIENILCFDLSSTSNSISFPDNLNNTSTSDFCLTSNQTCYDVDVIIIPLIAPRPGFDARYQIVYKNKGSYTRSGDINFTFNDAVLDYVSASVIPDNQTTGNLTWNYSDLVPFETRSFTIILNVNGPTETPAVYIGDALDFVAIINPITDDDTPPDNVFELTQTVVGSYDPNDKTCLEGDSLVPEMIGEYLHYNINFENTGTAAATFVVVKDVINETMFDISTLQVMHASHDMVANMTGNTIEFIFDEINLGPDEKGNVVFKVKTLSTLAIDDSVSNMAEIYFDYNFPIVTNTTITTFETLSVQEFEMVNTISVFPNPAKNTIEIKAKQIIESITVYDVQGRLVISKIIQDTNAIINVSNFTNGIYFLNVKTALGESVEKIIKN